MLVVVTRTFPLSSHYSSNDIDPCQVGLVPLYTISPLFPAMLKCPLWVLLIRCATVLPSGDVLCWNNGLYCESSGLNRGLINGWKGVCEAPCCCNAASWWAKFEFASKLGMRWLKLAWRLAAAAACKLRWWTAAECNDGFENADAGREPVGGALYGDLPTGDFDEDDDAIRAETENGFKGVLFSLGVSGRPESDSDLPHKGDSTRVTTSDDDVPESADSRRNFSLSSTDVTASRRTCFDGSSRWHTRLIYIMLLCCRFRVKIYRFSRFPQPVSRNPLANGLWLILSCVIWRIRLV